LFIRFLSKLLFFWLLFCYFLECLFSFFEVFCCLFFFHCFTVFLLNIKKYLPDYHWPRVRSQPLFSTTYLLWAIIRVHLRMGNQQSLGHKRQYATLVQNYITLLPDGNSSPDKVARYFWQLRFGEKWPTNTNRITT